MGLLDNFLGSEDGRLGLALLAAGGPTTDPNKTGIGARLQSAIGSVDDWKQQQAQAKRAKMQEEFQQFQMDQARAQAMQQEKLRAGMGQFFKPGQNALSPLLGDPIMGILPSSGKAAVAPSFDAVGAAQFLAQNGDYEKAFAMMPKAKEASINKLNVSDFTPVSVAKFAQSGNYGDLVRLDKAHFANVGGQTIAADPFTGKPLNAIDNTQSPDSRAGNAVTIRGQNLTNARAREANAIQHQAGRTQIMQTPEGLIAIDKGTNKASPVIMGGTPVRSEDSMKKTANAKTVISLLDEADKLLPSSTGSLIGAGADIGLGAVGLSTKGAKSVAQLKAIEGQLIASMPRMEGPQSDSDRLLYQKAAGDLANPMTPVATRQAASGTIRKLQERYAGGGSNNIQSLLDKYK